VREFVTAVHLEHHLNLHLDPDLAIHRLSSCNATARKAAVGMPRKTCRDEQMWRR
jgi:hypothetical protein